MDFNIGMETRGGLGQSQMQQEREQADLESLREDMGGEFVLPITHRPENNLDTENLEQASLDKAIPTSNIGYKLLQKMGWRGKGLGRKEQGIVEPIRSGMRDAKLGVGKQEEDDHYTAEENVQRKKLDVEIEVTAEIAAKWESEAARDEKVRTAVKEIMQTFLCQLCNKQYKTAMELEIHLDSYDHNHKKRFKEMRDAEKVTESRDERKRREQLREDKEVARMAQQAEAHRQQLQQQQQQQQQLVLQKQQQQQQQQGLPAGPLKPGLRTSPGMAPGASASPEATPPSHAGGSAAAPRAALKFGFGGKSAGSGTAPGKGLLSKKLPAKKAPLGSKTKGAAPASIFGDDDDEEEGAGAP